jgi:hypothetical protein
VGVNPLGAGLGVSRGGYRRGGAFEKGQRAWGLKLCIHNEGALMPRNAVSRIPRAEYLAGSLSRSKPWQAQGMSRAKWYRLGKPDAAETIRHPLRHVCLRLRQVRLHLSRFSHPMSFA